MSINETVLLG